MGKKIMGNKISLNKTSISSFVVNEKTRRYSNVLIRQIENFFERKHHVYDVDLAKIFEVNFNKIEFIVAKVMMENENINKITIFEKNPLTPPSLSKGDYAYRYKKIEKGKDVNINGLYERYPKFRVEKIVQYVYGSDNIS